MVVTTLVLPALIIGCQQQPERPPAPSPMPTSPRTPSAVPDLARFLRSGQVAAAKIEVANVEAAAVAYHVTNGNWPSNTNTDLVNGSFLNEPAVYDYSFDSFGRVVVPDGTTWPNDSSVIWSVIEHEWY